MGAMGYLSYTLQIVIWQPGWQKNKINTLASVIGGFEIASTNP